MREIAILLSITLFVACGGKKSGTGELDILLAKKDSLIDVYGEVGAQLTELQDEIDKLDSSFAKRATLVKASALEMGRFEHYFEVYGNVETMRNISINAEILGKVNKVLVEVGQNVSEGQRLIIQDTAIIRKSIDEVKTAFGLANTIYNRQKKLWDEKIGSELQYLEAKNRKESLEQKIETLQSKLAKSVIKAPFNGIIDEIFVREGELANQIMPVVRMINLDLVYLVADVSEDYISKITKGTVVQVNFPAIEANFEAKINRVGSYINANNRTFKIYVDIENKEGALKPNLLGIMNILDFSADSAITVSASIIQQDAEGNEFLYVLNKDEKNMSALKVLVQTGMTYKGLTHILSGLKGDEEIISKGGRGIKNGQSVKI
ncbi:MAG TPA: efflux RND transporter periplasmic adaptor subunit [Flavobacteriales bacterium]|nr:efflux RND transporter periplasmic adaptor subunit [Flavobacteriales bacterium]